MSGNTMSYFATMNIAIIEDEKLILEKLKLILDSEKNFRVVGTYTSAEEALGDINRSEPELLVVDLKLPGMNGIDLIKKIKKTDSTIGVLAFTVLEDRDTVISTFRAGADGYILKGSTLRELVEAIHEIQNGGSPISPKIARTIINELCSPEVNNHFILTEKEKKILKLIDQELSYKEIAEKNNISQHTVHSHIKNIYRKLKATCRKDALQKARRSGLL